ncbi:PA4642 family protein [Spongiibacter sp. KMU-158]|uniref:PA4642 family protein n=1 Tax=Spongiibacter pelagi TaxID=2760804 RepID=A0A927C3F6_9GAMM|nr:PA4642 family protein [Spongiibacter pelagi]MBD2858760.1 PA4642 family protein [Spongiibacter pelagi]
MKKDKQKVLDEVWDESRIESFLELQPADACDADFYRLQKAYQGMRADDFAVFLGLFAKGNHNINATDLNGRSLLSYVKEHKSAGDYAAALQQHGAC